MTLDKLKDYVCDLLDTTNLTQVRKNVLPLEGSNCASVRLLTKNVRYALSGDVLDTEYFLNVIIRGNDNSMETDNLFDEVCEKLVLINQAVLAGGLRVFVGIQPTSAYIGQDEAGNYMYNVDAILRI